MENAMIVDCVAYEKYCNLHCSYCFLGNEFHGRIPEEEIKNCTKNIMTMIDQAYEQGILVFKISGGEIFLLPTLFDIVEKAKSFERFQILTNGTLITEESIEKLKKYDNLSIQMTLDGYSYEMNKYRFPSIQMFEHCLNNFEMLVKNHIPVEINLCLTRNNIIEFKEFLNYLVSLKLDNVIVQPIPVREQGNQYRVLEEQFFYLEDIIRDYEVYQSVLPPIEYLHMLLNMLKTGKKPAKWYCHIPSLVLGIQGDGEVKYCPEIGTDEYSIAGNAVESSLAEVVKAARESPRHKMLEKKPNVVPLCKDCYTHYELINLYMNDILIEKDLSRIWYFRNEKILDTLSANKQKFLSRRNH